MSTHFQESKLSQTCHFGNQHSLSLPARLAGSAQFIVLGPIQEEQCSPSSCFSSGQKEREPASPIRCSHNYDDHHYPPLDAVIT